MRHIIPISGKDSCCTAIVQTTLHPDLPYEFFFSDVGSELPETYEWLKKVETKLSREIIRVGRSLEDVIYEQGLLPSANTRFCTRMTKIQPMEEWLGQDKATVYFGMRADEDRVGYQPGKHSIIPKYPLKDSHIKLPDVYTVLAKYDLHPPTFFWKRLHDMVLDRASEYYQGSFKLALDPVKYIKSLPTWAFNSLFAWRTRNNCYFCFFQRMYEWAGLLEHHPDLFDKAQEIEERVGGGDRRNKSFHWVAGKPLRWVRKNKDRIIARRVKNICKDVTMQTKLAVIPLDVLEVTSCGFFCGK